MAVQDPTSYIHSSPGASYDNGRNIREIEKKLYERDSLIGKHQQDMMNMDDE